MPSPDSIARVRRMPQMMLFAGFAAWYFGAGALAASAANGLAFRFRLVAGRTLLEAVFQLFLVVIGFAVLQGVARQTASLRELAALPGRVTAGREWLTGAALGWGAVVLVLLPLILSGRLHGHVLFTGPTVRAALLTVAMLAIATLTQEIAFRGHPFRCLTGAVGLSPAVLLMMLLTGFVAWRNPYTTWPAIFAEMLLTMLFSLTWLRTHAVWFAWGMHFALAASLGVLFGLPVAGATEFGSVVRGSAYGPDWLTGGDFGPGASAFALLVLLAGVPLLYRVTRDFAWSYTHAPIVAGGYEVTVAPPAAHTEMEKKAASPALVQILATTPQSFSADGPSTGVAPPPPVPDRLH